MFEILWLPASKSRSALDKMHTLGAHDVRMQKYYNRSVAERYGYCGMRCAQQHFFWKTINAFQHPVVVSTRYVIDGTYSRTWWRASSPLILRLRDWVRDQTEGRPGSFLLMNRLSLLAAPAFAGLEIKFVTGRPLARDLTMVKCSGPTCIHRPFKNPHSPRHPLGGYKPVVDVFDKSPSFMMSLVRLQSSTLNHVS